MGIQVIGHLPTAGDARRFLDHTQTARNVGVGFRRSSLHTGPSYRAPTLDYLTQVALAWERAGAHAALVPTGTSFEDAWVTASALMSRTRSLGYLVAFRPGLVGPVLAAQMMSTFQRLSQGRLLLNVTPGVPGPVSNRFGDWLSKSERLDQAGEFLTIVRGAWGEEPFDFAGRYFRVEGASITAPDPIPPFYFGGSSEESMAFAARHADVYLSFVEPPDMTAPRLERVRTLAAEHGRTVRTALSFQVITRNTAREAWDVAEHMLGDVDEASVRDSLAAFRRSGAGAAAARTRLLGRMESVAGAAEISPNLWVGGLLVHAGRPPALVGSHTDIADRLTEYHDLGVTEFQVTGFPDVEESAHFGEGVIPLLRERGLLDEGGAAT
ncbi:alkanesulfonate monooxygenase [Pseudonocardia sulfidoxydans NBRC 16205]|uniref:Alkanesulfonate monooxygenase n=1 Tax=Pseudonocardia sulfidoxydans NBRC 16205 TaxID=1223511 RepID=A0A511DJE8_9PSEU|nr:LLM class flavin-dependent oxidoreductase [Pseudonocardia sulfidoxydans]GEL23158.1 alkanesulfonate monooxygenase [Pseudonocardia sulfidoxydans NBRC 16205]